jgi:hypothetical protein
MANRRERQRLIAQRKRPGRVAYICVYDVQGTNLSRDFMDGLEAMLEKYLKEAPGGSATVMTVVQE